MNESFIKISRTCVKSQADPGLELQKALAQAQVGKNKIVDKLLSQPHKLLRHLKCQRIATQRCEYSGPVQPLTYFCTLAIEPNYHYSPSLQSPKKSELPTLMDEYTSKAHTKEKIVPHQLPLPSPHKEFPIINSIPRIKYSATPRYTIITIDTEHGKLAEEVSRERRRKNISLVQSIL